MLVKALLVKRSTDDGLMEFHDDIPLGKLYQVVLESRMNKSGYNVIKKQKWTREMIQDVETEGWLPIECLQIEP